MRTSAFRRSPSSLFSGFFLVCSLVFLPVTVFAQGGAAALTGRITTATGDFAFEGATVRIKELGRETTAANGGRYRFNGVPNGTYTLVVDYFGEAPQEVTVQVSGNDTVVRDVTLTSDWIEEVLIIGTRAGLASARNKERAADIVKTVVDADAIGQFADQNVAESLQRLPGVSIDRSEGEGRFVTVRGLGPQFNSVYLNGVALGTSGGGIFSGDARAVTLDTIPSELLEGIEVSKTRTPDMDADSIGGSIELKSLSAFDRGDKNTFSFRLEGSHSEKADETSPKVSAKWTGVFGADDQFGIAVAANRFEREIQGDEVRNDRNLISIDSANDDTEFLRPDEIDQRVEVGTRDRTGLTINLDYRPTDNSEYFFRFSQSTLEDEDIRIQQEWELRRANSGETLQIGPRTALLTDVDLERQVFFQNTEEEVTTFALGGENIVGTWTLDYQAAYSLNEFTNNDGLRARFRSRDLAVTYDLSNSEQPLPALSTLTTAELEALGADSGDIDGDATDLGDFDLDNYLLINDENEDEVVSLQFNAQREMTFGDKPGFLKFGLKLRNRDKTADRLNEIGLDPTDNIGLEMRTLEDFDLENIDTDLPNFGPFPDLGQLESFLRSQIPAARQAAAADAGDADQTGLANAFRGDFDVSEDILSAYIMAKVDINDRFRITGGVRVEQTDFEASAFETNRVDPASGSDFFLGATAVNSSNDYTDVFPSLHFRYDARDDIVIRGSFTQAIQRPTFDSAAPIVDIQTEEDENQLGLYFREAEVGNPDLDPLIADQLDVSVAWYPNESTYLSIGAFYKDIEDFFVEAELNDPADITALGFTAAENPDGTTASIDGGLNELEIVLNGDSAEVTGLELTYSQIFTFLPAPWNGLFADTNLTLVDSEAKIGEPRVGETLPLPNQADTIANISIGWENPQWTVRAAWNYRDEILSGISSDSFNDRIRKDYEAWDISIKYRINERFQVYADIINVEEESDRRFTRGDSRSGNVFSRIEDFGTTIQFGVSGSF